MCQPYNPHLHEINSLVQRSANIFYKCPVVNILSFTGHRVYVAATQLCLCRTEAAIENI